MLETPIALPTLDDAAPPLPAVLDLLRAFRCGDAMSAVYADGARWAVHELPLT